jgi:outer membrane protein OmpA-like peptidoglycan-associated protein
MRILFYILLPLVLVTAGCGFCHKTQNPHVNKRIIYRDLTTTPTIPDNVESTDHGNVYDETKVNILNTSMPMPKSQNQIHFVEFSNESSKQFDQKALEEILKEADKDHDKFFVLGHSHGNSAVGTIKLSTARAEKIGKYLKNHGFTNVFLMASWGKEPLPFSPNRGVQIFIVKTQELDKVPL